MHTHTPTAHRALTRAQARFLSPAAIIFRAHTPAVTHSHLLAHARTLALTHHSLTHSLTENDIWAIFENDVCPAVARFGVPDEVVCIGNVC